MTQPQLSKILNVSQPYIAKLEAGEANPTIGIIGGILGVLGYRFTANMESITPESNVDVPTVSAVLK
jgi:predicted transcriptional regulator